MFSFQGQYFVSFRLVHTLLVDRPDKCARGGRLLFFSVQGQSIIWYVPLCVRAFGRPSRKTTSSLFFFLHWQCVRSPCLGYARGGQGEGGGGGGHERAEVGGGQRGGHCGTGSTSSPTVRGGVSATSRSLARSYQFLSASSPSHFPPPCHLRVPHPALWKKSMQWTIADRNSPSNECADKSLLHVHGGISLQAPAVLWPCPLAC